jgi:hypothetical protein
MKVYTGMGQTERKNCIDKKKYWFTVFCFESDQLRFVNIFSPNKSSILCSVDLLCYIYLNVMLKLLR